MSFETAKAYIESQGLGENILVFDVSSATVQLAAVAVGCAENQIVKSLTFKVEDKPVMILCAGDTKISNSKYKQFFHVKANMLSFEEVHNLIGHDVGGVCPFGINEGVKVYLDESIKRFETVYPACGSSNSAVRMTIPQLEATSGFAEWIDVTQIKE